MKTKALFLAAAVFALILGGCGGGGGDSRPSVISIDIPSADGNNDGDITFDPVLTTYSIVTTAAADNVFVGTFPNPLDPLNPLSDTDSRGYLTFSLAQIPAGASIQSAGMFVRINDVFVDTGASVSVLPAMVSFSPLNTLTTPQIINLFNDAEILTSTVSYDVFPADVGTDVFIDVTDALLEARALGFSTLQIKLIGSFGRIVIDDIQFPPLMSVDYII